MVLHFSASETSSLSKVEYETENRSKPDRRTEKQLWLSGNQESVSQESSNNQTGYLITTRIKNESRYALRPDLLDGVELAELINVRNEILRRIWEDMASFEEFS